MKNLFQCELVKLEFKLICSNTLFHKKPILISLLMVYNFQNLELCQSLIDEIKIYQF